MPAFTLKGIPNDLYDLLKQRAAENRRSINAEMLVCLEEALQGRPANPTEMLAKVDAVRKRVRMRPFTEASLDSAKRHGRQ